VLFVVVSNPSWLIFEVVVFEVEVVALPLPLHNLYVLGDVLFVVVPFLLDAVTEDAAKGKLSTSVSFDTASLPLIPAVPGPSPLPPRKNLELPR
jgi:hypothetical protein